MTMSRKFENFRDGGDETGKRRFRPGRLLKKKARNEEAFSARCLDFIEGRGKLSFSAEEMALACKGSKGQALKLLDRLTKEGRVVRHEDRPPHDSGRGAWDFGSCSSWLATLYSVSDRP